MSSTSADSAPQVALTVLPYLDKADGRFRIVCTHCTACGFNTFPPTTVCPRCLSLECEPLSLSRTGVLYSFTTIRHAKADTFGGYVDFPEGIRVFGHLGGFTVEAPPRCDMTVQVVPAEPVAGARTSAPVDFKFTEEA